MSAAIRPVIESHAARVALGDATLLHDVALAVAPGERVAIVGHNGAGKSTLLKAMVGFAPVTRGSLRVLQTQLELPPDAAALRALRTKVALIHQGLHLVGRLSVLDNVLIGGAARYRSPLSWLRRWPVEEQRAAHAVLWQVGMGWAARRRTDSLSGGERQKVAIARALHQRAEILLADEPTASLDADAARDVARTLAEAATRHGATLVCVVHDLDLVPHLAARAIALRRGSVVADVAVTAETPEQLRGMLQ